MLYIALTFLSGIVSGFLSIWFRRKELQKKIILLHKQFLSQIVFFLIFLYIFGLFFKNVSLNLQFIELSWIFIYVLFSTVGYYAVQVFYEYLTGKSLFATQEEVEIYIKKIEEENQ